MNYVAGIKMKKLIIKNILSKIKEFPNQFHFEKWEWNNSKNENKYLGLIDIFKLKGILFKIYNSRNWIWFFKFFFIFSKIIFSNNTK